METLLLILTIPRVDYPGMSYTWDRLPMDCPLYAGQHDPFLWRYQAQNNCGGRGYNHWNNWRITTYHPDICFDFTFQIMYLLLLNWVLTISFHVPLSSEIPHTKAVRTWKEFPVYLPVTTLNKSCTEEHSNKSRKNRKKMLMSGRKDNHLFKKDKHEFPKR